MLYTSHAAKYGSRAGLGLTLIQYGFYSRTNVSTDLTAFEPPLWQNATDPDVVEMDPSDAQVVVPGVTSRDWLSFLLMTIGKSASPLLSHQHLAQVGSYSCLLSWAFGV